VSYLEAVAIWNRKEDSLTIFAVNRNTNAALSIEGDARAFSDYHVVEHITLTHPDLQARNAADQPNVIVPQNNGDARFEEGILYVSLPQASWNVIRL
jgi:alpha-N-arabinofuranosidase